MNQTISSRAPQKRLAPRLLCVMIGAALGTLSASSWAAAATDSTAENAKKPARQRLQLKLKTAKQMTPSPWSGRRKLSVLVVMI